VIDEVETMYMEAVTGCFRVLFWCLPGGDFEKAKKAQSCEPGPSEYEVKLLITKQQVNHFLE
jgi:hypothetical protein